jgi:hypothetical protein
MVYAVDPQGQVCTPPSVPEASPVSLPTVFPPVKPPPRENHKAGPRPYQLLVTRATPAALPDSSTSVASHILIDSGASAHMCPNRDWFTDIRPCAPSHILLGDYSTLVCQEEGCIRFTVHSGTHPYTFLLPNTLFAAALRHTLISCNALS